MALVAVLAGVDHAADGHEITHLVALDLVADLGDAADDLMAGDNGVLAPAPVVAGHVQVGVADAAIEDLHSDVVAAQGPALEVEGA
jgi:hypothetical protein